MVSLSNHDTVERSSFDKLRMSGKVRMSGVMLAFLCLFALATRVRLQPETAVQALGLPPGWNLIADPGGIVTSGPAYTYQIGDAGYETVPAGTPLVPGLGYWVLATSRSAVPLGAGSPAATILAPAGQVVMVGNPSGILPAAVHGADMLITYDPVNGYHQVTNGILTPGQGAFALSVAGGQIQLDAQGTTAAICSTAETGSACPVGGACPQGYPVAITQDGAAHPAPGPGDPALQVTPVLCFNAFSQALGAGYQAAARTRLRLDGPVSVTTSDMRFTVLSAMLESPDAFMARVLASGDQLCAGCNVAGATAVVTLQYGVENLQRPPTMFSAGQFVSAHDPRELPAAKPARDRPCARRCAGGGHDQRRVCVQQARRHRRGGLAAGQSAAGRLQRHPAAARAERAVRAELPRPAGRADRGLRRRQRAASALRPVPVHPGGRGSACGGNDAAARRGAGRGDADPGGGRALRRPDNGNGAGAGHGGAGHTIGGCGAGRRRFQCDVHTMRSYIRTQSCRVAAPPAVGAGLRPARPEASAEAAIDAAPASRTESQPWGTFK